METYYQKEKQMKEEYLKPSNPSSQGYQKQDLKDLYSMINLFEGLILEAKQKSSEKRCLNVIDRALNKK